MRILNINGKDMISSNSDIPKTKENIEEYYRNPTLTKGDTEIGFLLRIQYNGRNFFTIKEKLLPWLKERKIGMYIWDLESCNTTIIGWLHGIPPYLVEKKSLVKELNERIGTSITYQIRVRMIYHPTIKRLKTLAISIECDRGHEKELVHQFVKSFDHNKERSEFPISATSTFIPIRMKLLFSTEQIQRIFQEQSRSQ